MYLCEYDSKSTVFRWVSPSLTRSDIKLARVGRYNKADPADGFGSFLVIKEWIHPLYYDRLAEFDFKLYLLNGRSENALL